jgi:hypothetical protein
MDCAMARAYLIGSDGHFFDTVPLVCADDAEAIEKVKQLLFAAVMAVYSSSAYAVAAS